MAILRDEMIEKSVYNFLLNRCRDVGDLDIMKVVINALEKCDGIPNGVRLAEIIAVYNNSLFTFADNHNRLGTCSMSTIVLDALERVINKIGGIFRTLKDAEKKYGLDNGAEDFDLWLYYKQNVGYLIKTLRDMGVLKDEQCMVLYNTHSRQLSLEDTCKDLHISEDDYKLLYKSAVDTLLLFTFNPY